MREIYNMPNYPPAITYPDSSKWQKRDSKESSKKWNYTPKKFYPKPEYKTRDFDIFIRYFYRAKSEVQDIQQNKTLAIALIPLRLFLQVGFDGLELFIQ